MILEVEHLKKTYTNRFGTKQVEALKDVTFSMEEGEYTAVMGESGSGKTTLLNLLASFDRPTSGDIILNGLPFRKIQDKDLAVYRRKNLGFVFQDFNLLDTLSVRDNIFLPLVLAGEKTEEMKKRLSPLVKVLRISDLLDKFPYEVHPKDKGVNGNLLQKNRKFFSSEKKRQKKNHSVNFHLFPRDTLCQVGNA